MLARALAGGAESAEPLVRETARSGVTFPNAASHRRSLSPAQGEAIFSSAHLLYKCQAVQRCNSSYRHGSRQRTEVRGNHPAAGHRPNALLFEVRRKFSLWTEKLPATVFLHLPLTWLALGAGRG